MKSERPYLDDDVHVFDTPLVFNDTIDTSNIKNVLLIDSLVSESQLFFDSANTDTFPIIYSYNSNRNDLSQLLDKKFSNLNLQRIAFVFHDNIRDGKVFLNHELIFLDYDILEDVSTFSPNTQLLIDTIKKFNVKHMDFLACNSLNYSNWRSYYDLLTKQTSVVVGASNDKTGNLNYGGDWIMENTNENVVNTYFNSNIQNYSSTLASTLGISPSFNGGTLYIRQVTTTSTIEYQYNATLPGSWTSVNWPVTIVNNAQAASTVLTVELTTNITISPASFGGPGTNGYFITGSNYITYDGKGKTVTINSVATYLGLIQNGTSALDGKHAITVKNIKSAATGGSTLNSDPFTRGAWICQGYFGLNSNNTVNSVPLLVDNCSNSADITATSGNGPAGIIGGRSFWNCTATVQNCYNTGTITTPISGGILGASIGIGGGRVTVTNCYNSGIINGNIAGGICGAQFGFNGIVTVTNCYNSGTINGTGAGGICGQAIGVNPDADAKVTNCYNTGTINGIESGGICGSGGGAYGKVTIAKCYNIGNITSNYSGGITGSNFGFDSINQCSITNCYNIGNIGGLNTGGICGSQAGANDNGTSTPIILIENSYSLGNIATTCGGILGGSLTPASVYSLKPTITIKNCYTSYTTIADPTSQYVAVSLQDVSPTFVKSSIIYTNVYSQTISAWSDSAANAGLTGTPTVTTTYVSNPGTTWGKTKNNSPYLLSVFNSPIYDQNNDVNYTGNYTSNPGLFTPGYIYSLINVNNNAIPSSITINATTGALSFIKSGTGIFDKKVFVSKNTSFSPYYYGYNFNSFKLTITFYTVTYNGNENTGGTVPLPLSQPPSSTVTVSDQGSLVRTGYTFGSWNTAVDGSGTTYLPSGNFVITSDTTLYAQWILISNICFPAGTPIKTDQGIIAIECLNPEIHTINKKPIVDITKTVTQAKYLVMFKKNSLEMNYPTHNTIMSQCHKVFYQGKMCEANTFLGNVENVLKVKYTGEILYNVLMEDYSQMRINNLICETLHPNNIIAKLYTKKFKYTNETRQKIIVLLKEYLEKKYCKTNKKHSHLAKLNIE